MGRIDAKSDGVIYAGNREEAEAGLKILTAGGNAVDAAARRSRGSEPVRAGDGVVAFA